MNRKTYLLFTGLNLITLFSVQIEVNAQVQVKNPESGKITIASAQFPVSADIKSNLHWIEKQIIESKLKKADIVHFPECALSGYSGKLLIAAWKFRNPSPQL